MNIEFLSLPFSREELLELHRAALMRYLMEEGFRKEQGLEPVDPPPVLAKMEAVLGIGPEKADGIERQIDDELWQHSWYAFTDEWAWFRARQDVLKKLDAAARSAMPREEIETLIERRYEEQFDKYVAEVDMAEKNEKIRGQKATRKTKSVKK